MIMGASASGVSRTVDLVARANWPSIFVEEIQSKSALGAVQTEASERQELASPTDRWSYLIKGAKCVHAPSASATTLLRLGPFPRTLQVVEHFGEGENAQTFFAVQLAHDVIQPPVVGAN